MSLKFLTRSCTDTPDSSAGLDQRGVTCRDTERSRDTREEQVYKTERPPSINTLDTMELFEKVKDGITGGGSDSGGSSPVGDFFSNLGGRRKNPVSEKAGDIAGEIAGEFHL